MWIAKSGWMSSSLWIFAMYLQVVDVFEYLEASESSQCRTHVKRVVRLFRSIVCPARSACLPLLFRSVEQVCLLLLFGLRVVECSRLSLARKLCRMICWLWSALEELKINLLNRYQFLARSTFNIRAGIGRHAYKDISASLFRCCNDYYSGKWKARMSSGQAVCREGSGSTSAVDIVLSVGVLETAQAAARLLSHAKKETKEFPASWEMLLNVTFFGGGDSMNNSVLGLCLFSS